MHNNRACIIEGAWVDDLVDSEGNQVRSIDYIVCEVSNFNNVAIVQELAVVASCVPCERAARTVLDDVVIRPGDPDSIICKDRMVAPHSEGVAAWLGVDARIPISYVNTHHRAYAFSSGDVHAREVLDVI